MESRQKWWLPVRRAVGRRQKTSVFPRLAEWVHWQSSQEGGCRVLNQACPSLCFFYAYLTGLLHQDLSPEGLTPGLEIKPKSNEVMTGNNEFYFGHFKMHISWDALHLPSSSSPWFLTTFPVSETQHKCTRVISLTTSFPTMPCAQFFLTALSQVCHTFIWTRLIFTTTLWLSAVHRWNSCHPCCYSTAPAYWTAVVLHCTGEPHTKHILSCSP